MNDNDRINPTGPAEIAMDQLSNKHSNAENENYIKKFEAMFVVPDSIPQLVDNAASEFKPELDEFVLRCLRVKNSDWYLMTFHTIKGEKLNQLFVKYSEIDKEVTTIVQSELIKYPSLQQIVTSDSGGSGGGAYNRIATFWKNAYYSGDYYEVSTSIPGPGSYQFFNNNLHNYNFNDCLSSHQSHIWYPIVGFNQYTSTVSEVKVWKNCDFEGGSHTFSGQQARWDDNWYDEWFDWPVIRINDQVSSIRIKYRVK